MKLRPWQVVVVGAIYFAAAVAIAIALSTGTGTFADDANRACERHGGVQWLDAHQGSIVCRDGTAR